MSATAVGGACVALVALFLPGLLLVYGALPFWARLQRQRALRHAVMGANAAVVGILGAALYNPVWTGAVLDLRDAAVALGCFLLLVTWRAPAWLVVALAAATGVLMTPV